MQFTASHWGIRNSCYRERSEGIKKHPALKLAKYGKKESHRFRFSDREKGRRRRVRYTTESLNHAASFFVLNIMRLEV
jgi:hypothetical protein